MFGDVQVNKDGLCRLVAQYDIPVHGVKKGDIGGLIGVDVHVEGQAWVDADSIVDGNILLSGKTLVEGSLISHTDERLRKLRVFGDVRISNSRVSSRGETFICGEGLGGVRFQNCNVSLVEADIKGYDATLVDSTVSGGLRLFKADVFSSVLLDSCQLVSSSVESSTVVGSRVSGGVVLNSHVMGSDVADPLDGVGMFDDVVYGGGSVEGLPDWLVRWGEGG